MSKTKKIKQKTTGFDIVFRVVTAVMAILMYPLLWFQDLIYIEIEHKSLADIIGSITQNSKPNLEVTYDIFSIPELIDLFKAFGSFKSENSASIMDNPAFYPIFVAIGFLAVALVLGLIIFFFAVFSNNVKAVVGLSATGFLCSVVSFFCFSEGFAARLIAGEITVAQLLGKEGNFFIELIFGLVGDVSHLNLESGFYWVMFLLLGILIWSISVFIVNKGDEKEKAMKAAAKKHN